MFCSGFTGLERERERERERPKIMQKQRKRKELQDHAMRKDCPKPIIK
jgi:hypothetical protein